ADGLVDGADGDFLAVPVARHDGPTVDEDGRHVEPGQRHRETGQGLVTGAESDDGVEHVTAANELDGVGDDLAGDEGGLHALGAHGDAVGDGDGVELHGRATGGADAFLD